MRSVLFCYYVLTCHFFFFSDSHVVLVSEKEVALTVVVVERILTRAPADGLDFLYIVRAYLDYRGK